ncbi:efflux RND transporter periplasmic adaptor subunit [Ferrimonas gelatinilytica]
MAAFTLSACGDSDQVTGGPPPIEVGALTLNAQPVTLTSVLAGRTKASLEAEVRPQISGIILEQNFREGAPVEKGQQLYLIDPAPFEARLVQAKAALSRARANLKTAQARAERYQILVDSRAVSRQDFDDAQAQYFQALADVETALAQVETAEIDLDYTRVYSPITGLAGRSTVTPGALVTASQAQPLVTVQQFDPIFVDVTESSRELNTLRRAWASGDIERVDEDAAAIVLYFDDGSRYQHPGEFKFADINVDVTTGTFTIRTTFPNPDYLLLPGMFVRAELVRGRMSKGFLVPARGVSRNAKGQATVMVLDKDNRVEQRVVEAAQLIGQSWLVTDGVVEGERVILEGLQYVRPGVTVTQVNPIEPEA